MNVVLYRKKPVEVRATQFIAASVEHQQRIADWCGGLLRGTKLPDEERVIRIQTLEGEIEARVGDWIIEGVKGEFYPCKPDIFDLTYDEVRPEYARIP